jgi:hypothetical protein
MEEQWLRIGRIWDRGSLDFLTSSRDAFEAGFRCNGPIERSTVGSMQRFFLMTVLLLSHSLVFAGWVAVEKQYQPPSL